MKPEVPPTHSEVLDAADGRAALVEVEAGRDEAWLLGKMLLRARQKKDRPKVTCARPRRHRRRRAGKV